MPKKKEITLMCVECGKQATEGSMNHPYCEKCFQKVFKGDYYKYIKFLKRTYGD